MILFVNYKRLKYFLDDDHVVRLTQELEDSNLNSIENSKSMSANLAMKLFYPFKSKITDYKSRQSCSSHDRLIYLGEYNNQFYVQVRFFTWFGFFLLLFCCLLILFIFFSKKFDF